MSFSSALNMTDTKASPYKSSKKTEMEYTDVVIIGKFNVDFYYTQTCLIWGLEKILYKIIQ